MQKEIEITTENIETINKKEFTDSEKSINVYLGKMGKEIKIEMQVIAENITKLNH